MADNINVTPGTGSTVAADDIGGVLHQRIKMVIGVDGVSNGDVSASNPMPVSAASLPLPSGASTSILQTTQLTAIQDTQGSNSTGAVANKSTLVGGVFNVSPPSLTSGQQAPLQVNSSGMLLTQISTMPGVAVVSSALPTGASTSANQTTTNSSLSSIDGKTPALGQALASASTPVVLTAAQMTTLTPLATVSAKLQDGSGFLIASVDDGNGTKALEVAQSATSFMFSTVNSTTVQLAASASFTGTIESIVNQQSASIILTTDQPGTLTFIEYIDAGGTRVSRTTVYSILANIPLSRSFALNGNYFKATFQNTGASTTTTLNLNTAYGTIPSATALGNSQVSLDEVAGLAFSSVVKGAQATNNLPVQDVKDSGRVIKVYSATFTTATTEAMITLTPISDGTAGGTATTFTVTSGKRFRIQSLNVSTRNALAAGQGVVCQLRMSSSGSVTTTSPLVMTLAAGTNLALANLSNSQSAAIPDGLEFSGTMQFGISQVGTATANNTVTLIGYEY